MKTLSPDRAKKITIREGHTQSVALAIMAILDLLEGDSPVMGEIENCQAFRELAQPWQPYILLLTLDALRKTAEDSDKPL